MQGPQPGLDQGVTHLSTFIPAAPRSSPHGAGESWLGQVRVRLACAVDDLTIVEHSGTVVLLCSTIVA